MAQPDDGRASGDAALRAEHDELAGKLGALASVEEARKAAYLGFATLLSFLLTLKFAWDRWGWSRLPKPPPRGRYPLLPILGFILFLVLLRFAVRAVQRSRAHRASERPLIARFEELRRILRLDP